MQPSSSVNITTMHAVKKGECLMKFVSWPCGYQYYCICNGRAVIYACLIYSTSSVFRSKVVILPLVPMEVWLIHYSTSKFIQPFGTFCDTNLVVGKLAINTLAMLFDCLRSMKN
jgi:hypothetical protein